MTSEHQENPHRVPLTRFFIFVGLELALALAIFAIAAPHAIALETSRPWMIVFWTAAIGLPLSLFEYLYHRYLLHSAVFPFMKAMHRAHNTHHGLTYVKASVTPHEPDRLVPVTSEFAIEEAHQEESMMFPLYALPIFFGTFLILMALPLKLLFPGHPIILSVIFAVTLYYMAYELWHLLLHLPFEKFWEPLMAKGKTQKMFRSMYGFHLMHHWRPTSNLAIVGFWGVAVWDHTFRTHKRPERLPLHQAQVNYHDAKLEKPLWPIATLDRWQSGLYRGSRRLEAFLARVFLRRKTD